MKVTADQFVDRFGRRMLTDEGRPGMDAVEGLGSSTEVIKGQLAASIFANCPRMNNAELDEIIDWVRLYKTRP